MPSALHRGAELVQAAPIPNLQERGLELSHHALVARDATGPAAGIQVGQHDESQLNRRVLERGASLAGKVLDQVASPEVKLGGSGVASGTLDGASPRLDLSFKKEFQKSDDLWLEKAERDFYDQPQLTRTSSMVSVWPNAKIPLARTKSARIPDLAELNRLQDVQVRETSQATTLLERLQDFEEAQSAALKAKQEYQQTPLLPFPQWWEARQARKQAAEKLLKLDEPDYTWQQAAERHRKEQRLLDGLKEVRTQLKQASLHK